MNQALKTDASVSTNPCHPIVFIGDRFIETQDGNAYWPADDWFSLYGGRPFCGIRVVNGSVFALIYHLKRLENTAQRIGFTFAPGIDELKEVIVDAVARNGVRDGYVRVDLVAPMPGIGIYNHNLPSVAQVYVRLYDLPFYLGPDAEEKGVDAYLAQDYRNTDKWKGTEVKLSGDGYARARIHKQVANSLGMAEVLFRYKEHQTGAYFANGGGEELFIKLRDWDGWRLVPDDFGILCGITRTICRAILLSQKMKVSFRPTTIQSLVDGSIEAMVLMGTAVRVVPVNRVYLPETQQYYTIGDGTPHREALKLVHDYRDLIEGRADTNYGIEGLHTPVTYP